MARTSGSLSTGWLVVVVALVIGTPVLSAQSFRGRDRIPPTAPTNLVVTATTPHSVSLAWSPSTDDSGRFSYLICCAGTTQTVSQTVTSYTLQGLNSGATYVLRVYARDAAGNLSASSNPVTVTLPGDPGAPTTPVVTLLDVGPTHASLRWSATDDGPTIWYTVYIDGRAVTTLNSKTGTFTPLDQETTYAFTVRARDVDGNLSPFSAPLFVTTDPADPNDHTPPTPPANLTAERDGAHLIVRWDPSTDDLSPQAFIRYDVYVNDELRAVVVGSGTATVEAEYGVNTVTVIAVDTADNASAPSTITATF